MSADPQLDLTVRPEVYYADALEDLIRDYTAGHIPAGSRWSPGYSALRYELLFSDLAERKLFQTPRVPFTAQFWRRVVGAVIARVDDPEVRAGFRAWHDRIVADLERIGQPEIEIERSAARWAFRWVVALLRGDTCESIDAFEQHEE